MTQDELKKIEPFWDSWYIDECIGHGSFGDVYRIKREEYGKVYYSALKIMSFPKDKAEEDEMLMTCGGSTEEAHKRYDEILNGILGEIDIMEQLKGNTNIVSYEDHKIINHNTGLNYGYDIFIRMELLRDLSRCVVENPDHFLSEHEVIKVGADMCEALRLCHNRRIIHRDIKPANIFVSQDGNYKLGDFGIARSVSDKHLTMSFKGTYNFMAPEIFNRGKYDDRADIYSLGMVLYYLMNGFKVPFYDGSTGAVGQGMKEDALTKRMRGDDLPKPINASGEFSDIILKACQYNQKKRYKDVSEFENALLSIRSGSVIYEKRKKSAVISLKTLFLRVVNIFSERKKTDVMYDPMPTVEDDSETVLMSETEIVGLSGEIGTNSNNRRGFVSNGIIKKAGAVGMYVPPTTIKKNDNRFIAITVILIVVTLMLFVMFLIKRYSGSNVPREILLPEDMSAETKPQMTESEDDSSYNDDVYQQKNSENPNDMVISDAALTDTDETAEDGRDSLEHPDDIQGEDKPNAADENIRLGLDSGRVRCIGTSQECTDLIIKCNIDTSNDSYVAYGDRISDVVFDEMKTSVSGKLSITSFQNGTDGSMKQLSSDDIFTESGYYGWEFEPEDERYGNVTGILHVTVLNTETVVGVDELSNIGDKSGVLVVDISGCNLVDLSLLEGCTNLTVLSAEDNKLKDISILKNMKQLQVLSIMGNDVLTENDVMCLKKLKYLKMLTLPEQLEDMEFDLSGDSAQ